MHKRPIVSFIAIISMLAFGVPATAGSHDSPIEPQQPPPWEVAGAGDVDTVADLWFVEFFAPPATRGGSARTHARERVSLRDEARAEGISVEVRRDFTTLWNGVSLRVDPGEAWLLSSFENVRAVYPVAVVAAPDPHEASPELATALEMTGASHAQDLGLRGEGLSVAIIDTGIDYRHPDLAGDGDTDVRISADADRSFDHPRITHGWDYVGDEFNPADPAAPQEPDPNPDPLDLQGHGTHVAGIVGAEGEHTGVAPGVSFGAYKVFGPGSTTADVIVDALEDAYVDGMKIVNMSLGAAFVWGQDYPTNKASNELVAQGVVVVNSAGNSGGAGAYSLSAPANAHDIISVASADNTFFEALVFEVDQLDDDIPYSQMSGAEMPPTEGESEEVVWLGRACVETEGDELLDDPDGKVGLIVRGDCTFAEKYLAAADGGATGVVIFNNVAGQFAGTIGDAGVEGVWSVGINNADGQALRDLILDGENVVLGFTDETATLPNPTGGLVSSFSSYGLDPELAFGPSVLAPGGLITSTYPLERGGSATLSGTSMSAPHVAGAAALLLKASPELDPIAVRDRLQNTAEPVAWWGNPGLGFLDNAHRQGAGMIRIDRAVQANQHAVPGQLSLGDGADPHTVTVTLASGDTEDVTYAVGHVPTLSTGLSTFTPGFFAGFAGFSGPSEVTIPAGGTADVTVTITPPVGSFDALPNHQFGGYVTFTPDGDATALRVVYGGFDGDYQRMPLLGHVAGDGSIVEREPRLARIVYDEDGFVDDIEPVEPGHVYALRDGDYPLFEAFFGHFPQEMRVYVHHIEGDESHLIMEASHLRRSPGIDDYWPFAWSGMVRAGEGDRVRTVPSGTYTFEVHVLRTLGDPDNPDHWETWMSPEFEVEARRGGPRAEPGPPPGRGPGR